MESNKVIKILIAVIIIMALVMAYFIIIKPQIDKATTNNQVTGFNIAIQGILDQLNQQGYVQLTIGNRTLILVPYNPQNQNIPQTQ